MSGADVIGQVEKLLYDLEMVQDLAPGVGIRTTQTGCRQALAKVSGVAVARWLAGQVPAGSENQALVLLAEAGLATEGMVVWKDA